MILEKIILGISLAAPIGPVSAEMIRRGLKDGFWAAFNIRIGGAIGNSVCLIAAFFGLSALTQYRGAFSLIGLTGAALLFYMGITTILKTFKEINLGSEDNIKDNIQNNTQDLLKNSLVLGFILAVANPIAIAFWLGIGAAGLNSSVSNTDSVIDIASFLQNFLIIVGVLLWGGALSLSLEFGRRLVTDTVLKVITFISGTILLYFGCKYGFNGAQNLMLLLM